MGEALTRAPAVGRKTDRMGVDPICLECGGRGVLTRGEVYKPENPRLAGRLFFVCACGAAVACHPGTALAMGYPAGPETALARDKLHRSFDPIWTAQVARGVRRATARERAYRKLGEALGLDRDRCHISMFDLETCRRALTICRGWISGGDGRDSTRG